MKLQLRGINSSGSGIGCSSCAGAGRSSCYGAPARERIEPGRRGVRPRGESTDGYSAHLKGCLKGAWRVRAGGGEQNFLSQLRGEGKV